jgi:hypothetical protein
VQLFCFEQFLEIATCNTAMSEWHDYRSGSMMKSNSLTSMADVLEREVEPTIKEWLRRVNLVPELTDIPLKRCRPHRPSA